MRLLVLAGGLALSLSACAFSGSIGKLDAVTKGEVQEVLDRVNERDAKQDAALKAIGEWIAKQDQK